MRLIKAFLGVVFLAGLAYAASNIERLSKIGPSSVTGASNINNPSVSIAGVTGIRNCISEIDAISDRNFSLTILAAGTTSYNVDLASGAAIVRSWDDNSAVCGAKGAAVYIQVSSGTYKLNYGGFTY